MQRKEYYIIFFETWLAVHAPAQCCFRLTNICHSLPVTAAASARLQRQPKKRSLEEYLDKHFQILKSVFREVGNKKCILHTDLRLVYFRKVWTGNEKLTSNSRCLYFHVTRRHVQLLINFVITAQYCANPN
jgi:hypothetical protein